MLRTIFNSARDSMRNCRRWTVPTQHQNKKNKIKQKNNAETNVHNSHAAQTSSKATNQNAKLKMFSASKYFAPPMEI